MVFSRKIATELTERDCDQRSIYGMTTSVSSRQEEIESALPADLDALPRLDGFRLRGIQMTRLETFIDAGFAFATTMLVIAAQQIPDDIVSLLAAFRNVPTFVFSVYVLAVFWRGHWLWSRRYGLEDGPSILISWAMLVTILIYIYPLKAVFGWMWYYLSNGRFGQALGVSSAAQARELFAVYAIGFSALAFEIWLLNFRAWQLRDALRLNARERVMTRDQLTGRCIPLGIGLLSLLLALTLPIAKLEWAGWVYFSVVFLVPFHARWRRRRLAQIFPKPD